MSFLNRGEFGRQFVARLFAACSAAVAITPVAESRDDLAAILEAGTTR
jgi:hypothetical protein